MGDGELVRPHSDLAERDVLSGVLIGNRQSEVVFDALSPRHFFNSANREVFSAFIALRMARLPITLLSVMEVLERSGKLDAADGAAYVASLLDGVPQICDLGYAARRVRDNAALRD